MNTTHKETVAYSDDPETRCSGVKPFSECGTARALLEATEDPVPPEDCYDVNRTSGEFSYFSLQKYMPLGCVACGHMCEISRWQENGQITRKAKLICVTPEVFDKTSKAAMGNIVREIEQSLKDKNNETGGAQTEDYFDIDLSID